MATVMVAKELSQIGRVRSVYGIRANDVCRAEAAAVPGDPVGVAPGPTQIGQLQCRIRRAHHRSTPTRARPSWQLTKHGALLAGVTTRDKGRDAGSRTTALLLR